MNAKIVIPISVIITIVIVVFSLTQNEIIEKQTSPEIGGGAEISIESEINDSSEISIESEINDSSEISIESEINDSSEISIESEINDSSEISIESEIQSMLDKIREDKIKNDNSYEPYIPTEREWIKSGPFQIDRSEYALGEKIFINIKNLNKNAKGTMIFTKIINSTHIFEYKKIDFDGSKPQQNFYLGINLFALRGICSVDELVGDWQLRFVAPNGELQSLDFKIKNQIIPGQEEKYEAVC